LTYGHVETLGVRDLKDFRQPLTIAYVSLYVKTPANDSSADRRQAVEVLESEPLLTIRAPAGAGKTTLLRWIALACARGADPETNKKWYGGVPLFVALRSLTTEDEGIPDLKKLVHYTIDPKKWPATPPSDWVLKVLNEKRAIIMLDGLDELPSKFRARFWSWIKEDLMERYPGNRIIITSRYLPTTRIDDWKPPVSFVSADLDEMTDEDVNEFVRN